MFEHHSLSALNWVRAILRLEMWLLKELLLLRWLKHQERLRLICCQVAWSLVNLLWLEHHGLVRGLVSYGHLSMHGWSRELLRADVLLNLRLVETFTFLQRCVVVYRRESRPILECLISLRALTLLLVRARL